MVLKAGFTVYRMVLSVYDVYLLVHVYRMVYNYTLYTCIGRSFSRASSPSCSNNRRSHVIGNRGVITGVTRSLCQRGRPKVLIRYSSRRSKSRLPLKEYLSFVLMRYYPAYCTTRTERSGALHAMLGFKHGTSTQLTVN